MKRNDRRNDTQLAIEASFSSADSVLYMYEKSQASHCLFAAYFKHSYSPCARAPILHVALDVNCVPNQNIAIVEFCDTVTADS